MPDGGSDFDAGIFWFQAIFVVALGAIPGAVLFGEVGAFVTGLGALLAFFWWVARDGSSD